MIVKIAGNNGSGKSTLIRALMKIWDFEPVLISPEKPKILEYIAKPKSGHFKKIVVLGDYRSACGGMDGVSDQAIRVAMVKKWCDDRTALVFAEGVLFSSTYGELGVLSEVSKVPWVYAFMDTPFELCVQRVMERRAVKGNVKEFNPEHRMRRRERELYLLRRRVETSQHIVYIIKGTQTPATAAKNLMKFVDSL